MRILNFGSVNIDHVYRVGKFVRPGETISCEDYSVFSGGKGANQSVALARAGAKVFHAGKIGSDGLWLKNKLKAEGIDVSILEVSNVPTGHAIIQVNSSGENSIILYSGANKALESEDIRKALANFGRGDILLLQNEVNLTGEIMEAARRRGLKTCFNPAPMDKAVLGYPLECVDCFIFNETEGRGFTGETAPDRIIRKMAEKFPDAEFVLTLGAKGVIYRKAECQIGIPAVKVKAVDTTAAGDTFIGYFIAGVARGLDVMDSLGLACRAAAICVTKKGAADSIPGLKAVAAAGKGRRKNT